MQIIGKIEATTFLWWLFYILQAKNSLERG